MAIVSNNKKVRRFKPLLLGQPLIFGKTLPLLDHLLDQDSCEKIEEALAYKLSDCFLQVIPYNLSEEDKEFIRKNKTNKLKVGEVLQKYIDPSFIKCFMPKKFTKRAIDYLLKLYQFIQCGGIRFTKRDSDGVDRDYYGFPLTMSIEKRQAFISGPSNRDDYAKSIGLNSQIDQRKKLKNIENREKDKVLIRKKFHELRRNKPRELKVDKILSEIQDLIKKGKMHYPPNKKNKFPTISTIRRIVNSVENPAVH